MNFELRKVKKGLMIAIIALLVFQKIYFPTLAFILGSLSENTLDKLLILFSIVAVFNITNIYAFVVYKFLSKFNLKHSLQIRTKQVLGMIIFSSIISILVLIGIKVVGSIHNLDILIKIADSIWIILYIIIIKDILITISLFISYIDLKDQCASDNNLMKSIRLFVISNAVYYVFGLFIFAIPKVIESDLDYDTLQHIFLYLVIVLSIIIVLSTLIQVMMFTYLFVFNINEQNEDYIPPVTDKNSKYYFLTKAFVVTFLISLFFNALLENLNQFNFIFFSFFDNMSVENKSIIIYLSGSVFSKTTIILIFLYFIIKEYFVRIGKPRNLTSLKLIAILSIVIPMLIGLTQVLFGKDRYILMKYTSAYLLISSFVIIIVVFITYKNVRKHESGLKSKHLSWALLVFLIFEIQVLFISILRMVTMKSEMYRNVVFGNNIFNFFTNQTVIIFSIIVILVVISNTEKQKSKELHFDKKE